MSTCTPTVQANPSVEEIPLERRDEANNWSFLLKELHESGLSLKKFCEVMGKTGEDLTPRKLRTALHRNETLGQNQNYDQRHNNTGRPSSLSPYCQEHLLQNVLVYPHWTMTAHYKNLLKALHHSSIGEEDLQDVPNYHQVRRFLQSHATLLRESGDYKENWKIIGPAPLTPLYQPTQLYVADSVTFKDIIFEFENGETKHPLMTFIMDASSRFCVWAELHWRDATSKVFMATMERAFLPEKRPFKSPQLWPAHGCPLILLTDNGSFFKNKDVTRACAHLGIKKQFSAPGCPGENGQAEAFAKMVTKSFAPELVEFAIGQNLAVRHTASQKVRLFTKRFYQILETYNQTPKKCLGGLAPIEYFEQHLPHKPLNRHSKGDVLAAVRVPVKQKTHKGQISYNGQLYFCPVLSGSHGHEVLLWVDPVERHPKEIEIEQKGKKLGIASCVPLDARALKARPRQSGKVKIAVQEEFDLPLQPEE